MSSLACETMMRASDAPVVRPWTLGPDWLRVYFWGRRGNLGTQRRVATVGPWKRGFFGGMPVSLACARKSTAVVRLSQRLGVEVVVVISSPRFNKRRPEQPSLPAHSGIIHAPREPKNVLGWERCGWCFPSGRPQFDVQRTKVIVPPKDCP